MCLYKQLLTLGVEAAEKPMEADPLLETMEFTSEVLAAPLESTGKLRKFRNI